MVVIRDYCLQPYSEMKLKLKLRVSGVECELRVSGKRSFHKRIITHTQTQRDQL